MSLGGQGPSFPKVYLSGNNFTATFIEPISRPPATASTSSAHGGFKTPFLQTASNGNGEVYPIVISVHEANISNDGSLT